MMGLFSAITRVMFRDEEGGGARMFYCSWRQKIPTCNQTSYQRCSGFLASLSVIQPLRQEVEEEVLEAGTRVEVLSRPGM